MRDLALLTDLYQLTMLQAYQREGMEDIAVFDLYVRDLPPNRNFLLAAGLEDALSYLEELSFSEEALAYLESLGKFRSDFLESLRRFRFSGSVRAVPEGSVVFGREPLLEVIAPIGQAQLVETYLLNQVTFQTMIASKGARVMAAAARHGVVDFGTRRTHGSDAAIKAARALYIAGFASTSNILAGQLYGIPVTGTLAHSYIEAHESEEQAFRAFMETYPDTVLLVDTYDTEEAVRLVACLAQEMGDGFRVQALRLDSGNLLALSVRARRLLDEAGLQRVGLVASGGLDEYEVDRLVRAGAPFTIYAVGTNVGVSLDAPKLDSAYKLVAYGGRGRMKLSPDKATLPGRKQVFRRMRDGEAAEDVIALAEETLDSEPLLQEVMHNGKRLPAGRATLEESRRLAAVSLAQIPSHLRNLSPADPPYRVTVSDVLQRAQDELSRQVGGAPAVPWRPKRSR